ncbi:lipopolysaccharide heptosyltransferase family protein [Synechococcus sp. CS-602]|uniref:glycosyltransferase family 9 protein n=1 Tax=Synechococcaceae TaxID=1890426 RepID=UPI0008FF5391|nr:MULTISPECIES: ADP-heptose--LPS heptosyltransferase [Synechococcaceae]MCT4365533.1 lipopolysaccharide heptosyltransferase family protein [Candidatus Regnicoccus frigidus MAG-AL1]APD47456.1 ADP-heptose--LPS heptosyltransferase [Synechococcus sp. SynAce01]MCT0202599.1 lipopolysaccharide heptosyltransferase family protein [Synechococcus sp. CS-603]MCT0204403.1 lipopolysaccharide heptosyltransferase family protein [Synechococcus sp. CS-602]MCT0247245.1 lipopolysaccharide heptosyltransferase fami
MRVLFLIPGGSATQLQAMPAVAATALHLAATVQVSCPAGAAAVWKLLPAVEKVLPFSFESGVSLAEWANLLGAVREPDFQACINLASGWPLDLLLSLTHIPTRIARSGFSATSQLTPQAAQAASCGWPNQALEAWLQPIEVPLQADAFRLRLPKSDLDAATAALPPGPGPLLLLAPNPAATTGADWPAAHWQALPEQIRSKLPDLRVSQASGGSPAQQAAQVAVADVVLSSDPLLSELALLTGTPLVALGRSGDSLPARQGVQGVGEAGSLDQLGVTEVLKALGLG